LICVDSSALLAIVLQEPRGQECLEALQSNSGAVISAANLTEAIISSARRGVDDELLALIRALGLEIAEVTEVSAMRAAEAYRRWGKSWHPASLNYGDCFAYELASRLACPLLFIGEDFSQTDIVSVL